MKSRRYRTVQDMIRCLTSCLVIVVAFASLALTSGCHPAETIRKGTVKADIAVRVKDPIIRKITAVTERFNITATGQFKGGTFMVRDTPLKIEPGTTFKLTLALPITDPAVISTKEATGVLWTSKPLTVNGIPAPQQVELSKGKVSADVDLVKTIGAFLFNILQNQAVDTEGGGDWSQALLSITVERSSLSLRKGAVMELGKQQIHIGDDSTLRFENLVIDTDFNYTGKCIVDVNFLKNCIYKGEKVDVDFNGGSMQVTLNAQRVKGLVTLTSVIKQKPIELIDCTYRFGKEKQSSAKADAVKLTVDEFKWQKAEGSDKPGFHFLSAAMQLRKTLLHIHNSKLDVLALFPSTVPARLQIDRTENGVLESNFDTARAVRADSAEITLSRPTTKITLKLAGALVGPISLTKSGDLQLSLAEGTAQLKEMAWSSGKRNLTLNTSGGSTLSITKGQSMDLTKDQEGITCTLPLTLKLGNANLSGTTLKMKLSKLHGTLVVDVDKEVNLDGKIDFSIAESNFLGSSKADVLVNGLSIESGAGKSVMHLANCSVVMPTSVLREKINKHLPEQKVYELNKVLLEGQKWRYRNAALKDIVLSHPAVDEITVASTNQAKFTASGDVEARGTIEKNGIIIKKDWQTKPWTAAGKLSGPGTVKFEFVPNENLADSELNYHVAMQLPIPDDIDLDWSKVNDGFLAKMERNSVIKSIQKMAPNLPVKFDSTLKLFPDGTTRFKSLKIKNFKTKPVDDSDIELTFRADSVL